MEPVRVLNMILHNCMFRVRNSTKHLEFGSLRIFRRSGLEQRSGGCGRLRRPRHFRFGTVLRFQIRRHVHTAHTTPRTAGGGYIFLYFGYTRRPVAQQTVALHHPGTKCRPGSFHLQRHGASAVYQQGTGTADLLQRQQLRSSETVHGRKYISPGIPPRTDGHDIEIKGKIQHKIRSWRKIM